MLKDVSVFVPSHERHGYLRRCLDHVATFAQAGARIIVADSSREPLSPLPKLPNLSYLHFPDTSFFDKMSQAADQLETPYTLMLPDDDLMTLRGVVACRNYLAEHEDCSVALGQFIAFRWNADGVSFCLKTTGEFLELVNKQPLSEPDHRICDALTPYSQVVWCLHRTKNIRDMYKLDFSWLTQATLYERFISLFMSSRGNIVFLPVFMGAREVVTQRYLTEGYTYKSFRQLMESTDPAFLIEREAMVAILATELRRHASFTSDRSRDLIRESLRRLHALTLLPSPNVPATPRERFEARRNPDLALVASEKALVVSNDVLGKSFHAQKRLLPVYGKSGAREVQEFYELLMRHARPDLS